MIKPYILIATLLLSSMLIAEPLPQHDHSDKHPTPAQQSHRHGTAQLTLALEDNALEIRLESPAANIVGFEHKASSEKQLKAVEKAKAQLESTGLFLFSGSDCSLTQAKVDMSSVGQQSHDHGHKDLDNHSEISANYSYNCSNGEKLEKISVNLITLFPRIETLKVMWLTDSQQGATELTTTSNLIRLR